MDPLHQFMIQKLIPIKIGSIDLSFTNSSLFMALTVGLVLYITIRGSRKAELVPNRFQSFVEVLYHFVEDMLQQTIGSEGRQFFPLVFAIFSLVLFGNLFGMMPGGFTFTSHIIVTFALALFVFSIALYAGISRFGLGFFKRFLPEGVPWPIIPIIVPVEVISYFFRPISLSVRLFANMMAGHVVLKIFASMCIMLGAIGGAASALGLLSFLMTVLFTGFEIFVACLQAYIFSILSCVYIQDALHTH